MEKKYIEHDPLLNWYKKDTVGCIRNIERFIWSKFYNRDTTSFTYIKQYGVEQINEEVAFYYICLFHVIRFFASSFLGSNPTWVKLNNVEQVEVAPIEIIRLFIDKIQNLKNNYTPIGTNNLPKIALADSRCIPIEDESIDLIITSPPYCTRIDYAVYTMIELALMGYSGEEVRELRHNMIGSPTIHNDVQRNDIEQLPYCQKILKQIADHSSKAAKSYYYKTYKQYIVEMDESIKEINRILKKMEQRF